MHNAQGRVWEEDFSQRSGCSMAAAVFLKVRTARQATSPGPNRASRPRFASCISFG